MFYLLLPLGLFVGLLLASNTIEEQGSDSRNFGGVMCMLVVLPAWLVLLPMTIREAMRPRGLRALGYGALWTGIIAGTLWACLWVIVHFKLLRSWLR